MKKFALDILRLSEMIPDTTQGKILNYQLTKSVTSTFANYRAVLRARSKKEFFSKLSISVEEADESEILINNFIKDIHSESFELLKMLAAMRKRAA